MRRLLRLMRLHALALATLAVLSGVVQAQTLQLAITVDDLPAHGALPPNTTRLQIAQSFLATFQREHLPPVYGFINGSKVDKATETRAVLEAWHKAGQPLGNHTWSHLDLGTITPEVFLAEVDRNEALLKELDPQGDTKWLRYPYLREGDTVEKRRAVRAGLAQRGERIAEVGMDFEDYLWNEPYARCLAKGDAAALHYLHDSYLQTADEYIGTFRGLSQQLFGRDVPYVLLMHLGGFDATMLPELLALYRRRGFNFVSLQQAEADPAYALDPDVGDKWGGSQLELLMTSRHLKMHGPEKPYAKLEKLCR